MQWAAVELSVNAAPGRFPYGVDGDAEVTDAVRAVLWTFSEWLGRGEVERELAAELVRAQRPLVDDFTAARAQVREVCDVLQECIERHVGRFS